MEENIEHESSNNSTLGISFGNIFKPLEESITGKSPSEVKKLIESNHVIYRSKFGWLSDDRDRIKRSRLFITTNLIRVVGFFLWLAIHFIFIHPFFFRDCRIKLYIVDYGHFLLTNNWFYLGITPYLIKLFKIISDEAVKKRINKFITGKESL